MKIVFISILLLALLGLTLLSAFFSSAETAFFSLSALRVQRLRSRNPKLGHWIAEQIGAPSHLLSTLLIGNTLVNIAISSLGYTLIRTITGHATLSAVITIPTITIILLIFGEIAPKRYAIVNAERLIVNFAPMLRLWITVMRPLSILMELITRLAKRSLRPERKTLTYEELLTAVEISAESGLLDEEERSMVDGIIRLSEMDAGDILTPRVDIEGLDLEDPFDEILAKVRQTTHTYLPLYRDTPDAIEGFLDVPRFLLDPKLNLRRATFPALFVPETVDLDDLLITLQRNRRHIACVLDEFGGTAGIVTRSDILEIITGELLDHSDPPELEIEEIDANRWLIDGSTSLDEINHDLDLELEADGADRIAGWATEMAGRFLRAGEAIEAQGCRVQIRRVKKLRIEQVILEKLAQPTSDQLTEDEDDDYEEPKSKETNS